MTFNTTSVLIKFLRGFYCGYSVAATNSSDYPVNWIDSGLAIIFPIYVFTMPYFLYSKDVLMWEEWTKVSSQS